MSFTVLAAAGALFAADAPDFDKDTRPARREAAGTSINGKPIAELRDKAKQIWPTILFEKDGKKVDYVATMETDDGTLEIEFFPDKAPTHVRSFLALSKAGFYDGLVFHRCIPGFMAQGGDPLGNGSGGPGYALPAEFNAIKHEKGILSAARTRDPNSAGSQFFLCHARAAHLDNQYTVFGKVVKGEDVIDKIVGRAERGNETPANPAKIRKVTVRVKGEDALKKSDAASGDKKGP